MLLLQLKINNWKNVLTWCRYTMIELGIKRTREVYR